jgi:hypothetical protein
LPVLITVDEYRMFTGDLSSSGPTCSAHIEAAQALVEDDLSRLLESQSVSETLELWHDETFSLGWVYPTVTPVTTVTSGGALHASGNARIRVQSLPASTYDESWPGMPLYVAVEYTGGYTGSTCPATLKRAIASLARASIIAGPAAVSGTKRVGDIAVTYDGTTIASPLDQLVPGISLTLRGFRKRVDRNRIPGHSPVGVL